MKVSFTLTRRDFIAQRHALMGTHESVFWLMRVMVAVFALKLAISSPVLPLWSRNAQAWGAAFLWAFFILTPPLANAFGWRRELRKRNSDLHTKVELNTEGVFVHDWAGQTSTLWTAIHTVRDNAQHIFVLRADKTSFIVPRRAFLSSAEAQTFAQFAHAQFQLAYPPVPVPTPPPISAP